MSDYKHAVVKSDVPILSGDNLEISIGDGGMAYWRIYGIRHLGESRYKLKIRKYVMKPKMFLPNDKFRVEEWYVGESAAQWMRRDENLMKWMGNDKL